MNTTQLRISVSDHGGTDQELAQALRDFLQTRAPSGTLNVTVCERASERQLEEARNLSIVDDGELEVDDNAEISAGAGDGYYISAWLWVPGGVLTVTNERINQIWEEHSFDLPDDVETLTPEYVTAALAYVAEEFGAATQLTNEQLTSALNAYAQTQQDSGDVQVHP